MKKLLRLKRYVRSGSAIEFREVGKHKEKFHGTGTAGIKLIQPLAAE